MAQKTFCSCAQLTLWKRNPGKEDDKDDIHAGLSRGILPYFGYIGICVAPNSLAFSHCSEIEYGFWPFWS